MKLFYLFIIATSLPLSILSGHVYAQEIKNSIFFMKTDSTAKIYTQLTFHEVRGSWTPFPTVYSYPPINGNYVKADSFSIVAEPNSFDVTQHNINVTYTIITKNNTKGTFEIFTGSWGYSYPLVVGLNESEVDPSIFYNFHPINCVFCPAFTTTPPSEKVVGYSNMVAKTLSNDSTTWITARPSSAVPEFSFAIPVLLISICLLIFYTKVQTIGK